MFISSELVPVTPLPIFLRIGNRFNTPAWETVYFRFKVVNGEKEQKTKFLKIIIFSLCG